MNVNKVVLDGLTLIDLSQDTAVREDVSKDKQFHLANGQVSLGEETPLYTTKTISEGGSYTIYANKEGVTGYDKIVVDVSGGDATAEERIVQFDPEAEADTIIEPIAEEYLSKVVIKSTKGSGYVIPYGELPITENGQYDVTGKATVIVDVVEASGEDLEEIASLLGGISE